jgi:tetratricopeptide (TPR) repeat protein
LREKSLKGGQQAAVLAEIKTELEEARAAWQWAVTCRQTQAIALLLEGLYLFHRLQGRFQEGRDIMAQAAQAISPADEPSSLLLAKIRVREADFEGSLGRYDQAHALLRQGIEVFQTSQAQPELAFALEVLGRVEYWSGHYDQAQEHLRAGVALYRQTGDAWGLAQALNYLGNVICSVQTDYDPTLPLYEESLALSRQSGDQAGVARVLTNLGAIAQMRRDFVRARQLYQESIAISRQIRHRQNLAIALTNQGEMAYHCGEYAEAQALLQESLDIKRETGNRQSMVHSLRWLGRVACQLGKYQEAKRRYDEALQITTDIGVAPLTAAVLVGVADLLAAQGKLERATELLYVIRPDARDDQEITDEVDAMLNELQSRLSPEVAAACRRRGEAAPPGQVISEILATIF